MKLKHIDIKNVCRLVPTWAAHPIVVAKSLNDLLEQNAELLPKKWHEKLGYWIEMTPADQGKTQLRVAHPAPGEEISPIQMGALIIDTDTFQLCLPINAMLKGSDALDTMHSVYIHSLMETEGQRAYVGVTKQRWFDRMAQHKSAAAGGSMLLFHRALRQHNGRKMAHAVVLTGVDHDYAMNTEERLVDLMGLYPKGLNMIPGGFAGLKYLSSLGLTARSAQDRDAAMQQLVSAESLAGKPNPLCAARWSSDQEYVNSVICGHSFRLTVSQVRNIRMLGSAGYDAARIASVVNDSHARVNRVLRGKAYARVA